ncbi:MAG: hypothetical protein IPG43_11660 [Proteobacteria bacterium]|nr:hypothetical protein [Pseudomonadota bacterium]
MFMKTSPAAPSYSEDVVGADARDADPADDVATNQRDVDIGQVRRANVGGIDDLVGADRFDLAQPAEIEIGELRHDLQRLFDIAGERGAGRQGRRVPVHARAVGAVEVGVEAEFFGFGSHEGIGQGNADRATQPEFVQPHHVEIEQGLGDGGGGRVRNDLSHGVSRIFRYGEQYVSGRKGRQARHMVQASVAYYAPHPARNGRPHPPSIHGIESDTP